MSGSDYRFRRQRYLKLALPPFKHRQAENVFKDLLLGFMSRIPELESLLDERPDDPFVIYALAREYEKNTGTMQALMMYEHLVNSHPDYIATYYHYARLLYTAGNKAEALKLLQQGIERGTQLKEMHSVGEMRGLVELWGEE
jgi:predicted Zn-dependent protease